MYTLILTVALSHFMTLEQSCEEPMSGGVIDFSLLFSDSRYGDPKFFISLTCEWGAANTLLCKDHVLRLGGTEDRLTLELDENNPGSLGVDNPVEVTTYEEGLSHGFIFSPTEAYTYKIDVKRKRVLLTVRTYIPRMNLTYVAECPRSQ